VDNELRLGDADGSDVRVLIIALDRALSTVPLNDVELRTRASVVRSVTQRLQELGVDGESLVRYGMAPRAALPLLAKLVSSATDPSIDLEGWRAALSIPTTVLDADEDAATDAVIASIHNIDSWVVTAPFNDVLDLRPPTPAALSDYVLENRDRASLSLPYIWLWLRCTQDDLDRWPTEALHLEYRWRNEMEGSPFPAPALEFDGPASMLLNEEIAFRASTAKNDATFADDSLFWQLQDTAVNFLKGARFEEAAALFDFHSRHHPDDARSLNNLGFCKLPIDPAASLDLLERAKSAGYSPLLINIYNQCCCLIRLNRLADALDRAEYFWQRENDVEEIRSGYIWVEDDASWRLVAHDMIDVALAQLMAGIAQSLGQQARSRRWSERAEGRARAISTHPSGVAAAND